MPSNTDTRERPNAAASSAPQPHAHRKDAFMKAVDADGNASMLSIAALKNSGLNRWRGWNCAVGIHSIHIDGAGNIEGATCHVGGSLGNIFGEFTLKSEWSRCTVELCYCSDDIQLPKAAAGTPPEALQRPINDAADTRRLVALSNQQFLSPAGEFRVSWNLGKRCNFNCSYCPPSVHDNHSPFVPEEKVMQGVEAIWAKMPPQRKLRFTFTGGEPTLHPGYLRIVKAVAARPNTIVVTNTNGTRHEEYLRELNQLSTLYVSVHFEFTQLDKLARKLDYLNKDLGNRVIVKMMAAPGNLERVTSFFETLDAIPQRKFSISVEPLVLKAGSGPAALGYSDEERAAIRALARRGFR